jgi:Ni,Fe-hydrogenase III large subunit
MLPSPIDRDDVRATVDRAVSDFQPVAQFLSTHADFRNRLMGVGVLDRALAEQVGATGLAARASGLFRDFRRLHPTGAESIAEIRACLDEATLKDDPYAAGEQIVGDAFARYATRVAEVSVSARIVDRVLRAWDADWQATEFCADVILRSAPNFRFGLGYAESWRGPVVYWLMKDKFEQIYRCKVCDPSMLNWPALKAAVEPHVDPKRATEHHTILLADFPIVNKSFNLSYAGNDL